MFTHRRTTHLHEDAGHDVTVYGEPTHGTDEDALREHGDERLVHPDSDDQGSDRAHELYGGMSLGADFYGWLVALSVATLLTGIIGAIVSGVSATAEISQTDAERQAGTIGIVAAVVLVVVAAVGYYAGGYVAGRMSRFDGARQGLGVWLIGLVVMFAAAAIGALLGAQYNVLDRVDLPQLPVSGDEASIGALVTGATLLVVTLLAALAGGKVGRNYHRKVDLAQLTS